MELTQSILIINGIFVVVFQIAFWNALKTHTSGRKKRCRVAFVSNVALVLLLVNILRRAEVVSIATREEVIFSMEIFIGFALLFDFCSVRNVIKVLIGKDNAFPFLFLYFSQLHFTVFIFYSEIETKFFYRHAKLELRPICFCVYLNMIRVNYRYYCVYSCSPSCVQVHAPYTTIHRLPEWQDGKIRCMYQSFYTCTCINCFIFWYPGRG